MEINLVRVRVGMIVRAVLLAIPLCAHAAEPDVKQPRVALRSGKLQGLLPQGAPGAVFEGIKRRIHQLALGLREQRENKTTTR